MKRHTRKAASILRGKLTQGSWKRLRPEQSKGKQRKQGEFNECSKLVPQTSRQTDARKKTHTFPLSLFSGAATGKYLITGDLIRFPL